MYCEFWKICFIVLNMYVYENDFYFMINIKPNS